MSQEAWGDPSPVDLREEAAVASESERRPAVAGGLPEPVVTNGMIAAALEAIGRRREIKPSMHTMAEALRAALLEVSASCPVVDEAGVLLRVIQRLNANPYSLTKSECIAEVQAMIAAAPKPDQAV